MSRVSAVDSERVSNHETRAGAAKPQDGGSDRLGRDEAADGLLLRDFFHGFRLLGDHGGNHRRVDGTRTDRVDTNAARRIFKGSALGESNHAMFGGMVDGAAGDADETSDRRIVHDRAALLLAHLLQLILHTEPHALEIDGIYAVELFAGCVGGFNSKALHTSIVEGGIQPSEGRDGLFYHLLHLDFISDIASNGDGSMTRSNQPLCYFAHRRFIEIDECHGRTSLSKSLSCREPHA